MKKTISFRTMAIAVFLLAGLLISGAAKAQSCSYIINNNTPCNAIVDVDFYELDAANVCVLCSSSIGVFVPAGASITTNCSCSGTPLCDVVVSVTMLGTPTSPVPQVSISNPVAGGPLPGGPYCTASENIVWGPGQTDINP